MITFKNLAFIKRIDGVSQARINFDNNYGISVVQGAYLYCDENTYEVAVLKNDKLYYETPITCDVLKYQTEEQINKIMEELQSYEINQY